MVMGHNTTILLMMFTVSESALFSDSAVFCSSGSGETSEVIIVMCKESYSETIMLKL